MTRWTAGKILGYTFCFWMVETSCPIPAIGAAATHEMAILYTFDGKGDNGFSDSAFVGVQRARSKLALDVDELEPRYPGDVPGLIKNTIGHGSKLVVSIGFPHAASMTAAAGKNPKVHFICIDVACTGPNVGSFLFKEQEGAYLAGFLAARYSKTGKIGVIGGLGIPPIKRFMAGYEAGAKAANAKVVVLSDIVGENDATAWNNPAKAKILARGQYTKGADVIFAVAGGSGLGIFEAARELKKYAIGVDRNQNGLEPGRILTSVIKRVDVAVFRAGETLKTKHPLVGDTSLGLTDEAIELAIDVHTRRLVKPSILNEVEQIRAKIVAGKIKVPS